MILLLDVDYQDDHAVVAGVGIDAWADEAPVLERALRIEGAPAAYEPGAFYKRELPPLLALLEDLRVLARAPEVIVVDGYVWLGEGRPGLGAKLAEACGSARVVGIAKEAFHDVTLAVPVLRGTSQRPLWVTSTGLDVHEAAAHVAAMHGEGRLPTQVRRVDRLARAR